jgi:hypothetical protein
MITFSILRYLQYDDWFYPTAGPGYQATVTWDAIPGVFPDGLMLASVVIPSTFVSNIRFPDTFTTRRSSLSWLTIDIGKIIVINNQFIYQVVMNAQVKGNNLCQTKWGKVQFYHGW